MYKDAEGKWYGIYKGILGFMVNTDELERLGLEAPADWADLLKPEYKDLIWLSNYNTAGTAKLVVNTMIQKYGHDEGIQYLVDLDKNIQVYTKSGAEDQRCAPRRRAGPCVHREIVQRAGACGKPRAGAGLCRSAAAHGALHALQRRNLQHLSALRSARGYPRLLH